MGKRIFPAYTDLQRERRQAGVRKNGKLYLRILVIDGTIHEQNCVVLTKRAYVKGWHLACHDPIGRICKVWFNQYQEGMSLQEYLDRMFGEEYGLE